MEVIVSLGICTLLTMVIWRTCTTFDNDDDTDDPDSSSEEEDDS